LGALMDNAVGASHVQAIVRAAGGCAIVGK
jgi:hypothetical protein